jgi:hypothetical protein
VDDIMPILDAGLSVEEIYADNVCE